MPTQVALGSDGGAYAQIEGAVQPPPEIQAAPGVHAAPRPRRGPMSDAVRVVGRLLVNLPRLAWMIVDVVLLAVGVRIGYRWFVEETLPLDLHVSYWAATGVFAAALLVSGLIFGLYERETMLGRSRILTRMLLTTGLVCVLAHALVYAVMYAWLSRRMTVCAIGSYLVFGTAIRTLACWAVHRTKRGLLLVGTKDMFESVQRSFREGSLSDFRLVGYVDASDEPQSCDVTPGLLPGEPADLPVLCRRYAVDDVVISTRVARRPNVMNWILPCLRMGCRVTNEEVYYEKAAGQILVDRVTPNWFLFADFQSHCEDRATLKRLCDVAVAAIVFAVSLPLWPLIALCIKLADGGPVFYSQDRVGQNGRVFCLYKFRTMVVGAENGQSVWASPRDPRRTLVGRILRKARLDELPQLYNILIGDMSVVGPRPERPSIVLELSKTLPYYELRHVVKPGLTGWAQISYHYGSSIEDARRKLQFDLYYLKHMSVELDVVILFRTLGTFLRGAC
ncbi:MAG: exopolysaccharide biosynthesis polyprenyl glycosylphosphotransferase [Phycisphaerales bacterium]|nr:MAG: exopolysaccharide biosynthesis polyprenyl glycosylphosphotransferase [Phycisphaerales bacterium]